MERDYIDGLVEDWIREIGGQVPLPLAIAARLWRLASYFREDLEGVLVGTGINSESFEVLILLRIAAPPHRLSPTDLSRGLRVSRGAVTNRMRALVRDGFVTREGNPLDRRSSWITLTSAGMALVDRLIPSCLVRVDQPLAPLSMIERNNFANLLRQLLLSYHDHVPLDVV